MFSPRVRASLAIFLRFCLSVKAVEKVGEVGDFASIALMLKEDATGDSGCEDVSLGPFVALGFIRLSAEGTGTDRNRRRRGCARACGPLPFLAAPDVVRERVCEPGISRATDSGAADISFFLTSR